MHCQHCGAALGVGRFCTNCGQPIPGRHEGVPAAPPAPPPTRYPLYADGPAGPRPTAPPTVVVPVAPPPPPPERPSGRGPGPWLLSAVLGLAAVLVVGIVLVLVLGGGDDTTAEDPAHRSQPQQVPSGDSPPEPPSQTASTTPASTAPASSPTTPPGPAQDLASVVRRIQVPGTAAASTDARTGAPVTFEAGHLTDGDPTTCWRVDGDASGSAITITFAQPVTLSEVGLVNGYAKSYPGYDGYKLNRRVLAVRWVFDDGTTVDQQLTTDRRMQTVPVQAGETSHLQLEIVSVSPPGGGPLGKDFTPISELDLTGATG